MRVSTNGEAVEVSPLVAAMVGWLVAHEGELLSRDNGTITANYSVGKGTVELAHLGRDNVQFVARPRR